MELNQMKKSCVFIITVTLLCSAAYTSTDFSSASVDVAGPSLGKCSVQIDFPNYFDFLSPTYSLGLINEAMHSVIERLEVLHVDPVTGLLSTEQIAKLS
jgi:hypothetical protein